MASVKGDPKKDKAAIAWTDDGKKLFDSRFLKNLDQRTLRATKRALMRLTAEVDYYLDVRNEQGRGGK